MILPPVVRAFFAIDLPKQTKAKIGDYIGSLQKMSKSNVVRWSKPENLHITLQFLAEVRGEHIAAMIKNVRKELVSTISQTKISIKEMHLFPDPHRPRVIVLDVSPQETLAELSASIGRGIELSSYETEKRSFRAHLTIGRIKTAKMHALSFLTEATAPVIDDFNVDEVVLFQSEPHPEGSKYIPLERICLHDVSKSA